MALTNAERQARYREKHFKSDDADMKRLKLVLDIGTRNKLTRIAAHRGTSVTALIRKWAEDAERRIVDRLTTKEQTTYYDDVIDSNNLKQLAENCGVPHRKIRQI